MTDKPIIFSAPMVRALLEGRKTMTRRVLWPQPVEGAQFQGIDRDGKALFTVGCIYGKQSLIYAPGDRLWVREAHVLTPAGVAYVADGVDHYGAGGKLRKRPSIHMPRWASRLTLTVTEVRVQRLHDISAEDAVAEGWPGPKTDIGYSVSKPLQWFPDLWNSLHGPDAWDANPWCVAVSFKVQKGNIDAL